MSLRVFLVVAVNQVMLASPLQATECEKHRDTARDDGLPSSAGIFDASTATFLYTTLGDGVPTAKEAVERKGPKTNLIPLFLTAVLPLLLDRRRRRP